MNYKAEMKPIITNEYELNALFKDWVNRYYATQKEAARDLEISEQYLSDIVRGKRAVPSHLVIHTGYQQAWIKTTETERG